MLGLLIQCWSVCSHCDGGGDALSRRSRRRRSVESGRVWTGFHVTGLWRGFLGALFVSADWQVRVFWSSGIVYRPSDRLYVRTIPLSVCMDRRSSYMMPISFLLHQYRLNHLFILFLLNHLELVQSRYCDLNEHEPSRNIFDSNLESSWCDSNL